MAAGYAAALAAGGVLFAYTKAFFTSPLHREDPHALPVGEQYINERRRMLALIEELEQIPFEPVTIRSRDGLKLYGRYYHVRDGAPVQIQVHGYRGSALRDFCGGSKLAREMGMNILLQYEGVRLDSLLGHGGLFKVPVVGQKLLAGALGVPVTVRSTAGEGGPWGMALLAAYLAEKTGGETLEHYLADRVFAGSQGSTLPPDPADSAGFARFLADYRRALPVQRAAGEALT